MTTHLLTALTEALGTRFSRRAAARTTGIGIAAGLLGTRELTAFAQDATPVASPESGADTDSVVLINMFEVPADLEDAFLAEWNQVKAYTQQQVGFISTRLHRSLDPQAQYRFINIVQWRSAEDVRLALTTDEFMRLTAQVPVTAHPVVYQVISE